MDPDANPGGPKTYGSSDADQDQQHWAKHILKNEDSASASLSLIFRHMLEEWQAEFYGQTGAKGSYAKKEQTDEMWTADSWYKVLFVYF
jgi:hypothetical protein